MNLQRRIDLLSRLGEYIKSNQSEWQNAKERAARENPWFIPEFIELAVDNIATAFLEKQNLQAWCQAYHVPPENKNPQRVGIVMAGNIPLVGFHDFLSVFIAGHKAIVKPSSKDNVLFKHLVETMKYWDKEVTDLIEFGEMLKGCDAYIATGSNNSAGYFDYYFGKYPHIIRRNRTSVAILTGKETAIELQQLADDVYCYFGLGCRNVTKIYVPHHYDFLSLLNAFKKYNYLADHNKYKNNYDYNLAILILNKKVYMSNESILLVEEKANFSPIGQLHFEYYQDSEQLDAILDHSKDLQCLVGKSFTSFGQSQKPSLQDYADGIDTMRFLLTLSSVKW
jgi:hypothetical protein